MIVVGVLKEGPEYGLVQARWLWDQLIPRIGNYTFVWLTDVRGLPGASIPLRHGFRGWWSKMELFDPASALCNEDIFFLDVDVVVRRSLVQLLDEVSKLRAPVLLSDFYHPHLGASGCMYLPSTVRKQVWEYWYTVMRHNVYIRGGDQVIIRKVLADAQRWQNLFSGVFQSYKVHCHQNVIKHDPSIICFHGKPRPWNLSSAILSLLS